MSFQPLDPELQIDPFNTPSLTGFDSRTGIFLDADQTNSSVLVHTNNTAAMYIDKFQNMGINTLSPSAQLDINSSSGSCIQLTYNNSSTSKANIGVTSDGKLVLTAGGSEVNVDTLSNFNIKSHNGSTSGLLLGNSLVLSTADQLNFTVVTPGTAANSKALVLNSSGSIAGINSLSASSLVGTIETASQPKIRTLDVVDIAGHNGLTAGLSLGGFLITSTAEKLNYADTTPGLAAPTKALVLDANRDIASINSLSAAQLTGVLQTAAQPNITSLGTLTSLDIEGNLTGLTELSLNTIETGRTLVVNHETGNCVRLYHNAAVSVANYTDILVNGLGNLILTSSGGNVDITSHDGASQGLQLGGVLVTASADQVNYLQGTTPGNVSPGKAMIIDSNRNIGNINSLTAESLTGTIQTAAQPHIASVNALNIATHDGTTQGLKLNGALVTAIAEELNYVDTTQGTAEASKALVVDAQKDIVGINSLSASFLTGTLQTAAQPNITSVGTLDSISTAGPITIGTTTLNESELAVLDEVIAGTASAGKVLLADANVNISGINSLSANELTGTILTAAQPNIASVTTLNITGADGALTGLELAGVLVTSTAAELNYVDTVPGTAAATKALVLDANKDIANINSLSAVSLTGTLLTAAQPNITSVGTLSSLAVAGDVTVGSTIIDEAEIAVLDGVVPGIVSASKALVVDADKNINTINTLTAVGVVATDLTGTIQTAAQPLITSVTTLDITAHDGEMQGLRLGGELLTATAAQINSIFGAGGEGTFTNLTVNDTLTLANHDGISKGLVLGTSLVTATGDELNHLDGSLEGIVVASKAVVVDEHKDITSFRNLTAENLTGTIQTAAQPLITSVGTLTSISTSGDLTMGLTTISENEVKVLDGVVSGTAAASKALVLDASKNIFGIGSISAKSLTLLPSIVTYGETFEIDPSANRLASTVTPEGLSVYSPTQDRLLRFSKSTSTTNQYMVMNFYTGYTLPTNTLPVSVNVVGAVWHPVLDVFVIRTLTSAGDGNSRIYTSPTGLTGSWTQVATFTARWGSNLAYHAESNSVVFFDQDFFHYSFDLQSWARNVAFNGAIVINSSNNNNITNPSTMLIGDYAVLNLNNTTDRYFAFWNGSSWERYLFNGNASLNTLKDYHIAEDRLYIRVSNSVEGSPLQVRVVDDVSTKIPEEWISTSVLVSIPSTIAMPAQIFTYVEHYGILVTSNTANLIIINNKTLTKEVSLGVLFPTVFSLGQTAPILWSSNNTLVIPSNNVNSDTVYSVPSGLSDGILFGSTTITEDELAVVDSVVPGTASASKALVLDSTRNITNINSLTATSLVGTIATAAQPNITSVGTLTSITTSGALTLGTTSISESEIGVLDGVVPGVVAASKVVVVDENKDITSFRSLTAESLTGTLLTESQPNLRSVDTIDVVGHDATTAGLRLAGALVTSTATELNYIDGSIPGTVVPGSAVVADGNKDISSFRNLTSVNLTSTAGSLTMGGTTIDETEIAVIDDVVPGTAALSKALVLDANKDISGINSLSSALLTSTAGSLTMGLTTLDEAEVAVLDAVVPGTAAASKALVVDASKNISEINALSSSSLTSTAGSLTMGLTTLDESEVAVLDAVIAGTVSPSKAVVVDENKDITSFRNLTAVNLTGTIQTAAQPLITSVGSLDSLSVVADTTIGGDLILAGTTLTGVQAAYLSGATPGSALPTTALVVDELKNIDSINTLTATSLVATNLTGTIQTASQPLITSVSTLDITAHDGETQGLKLGGVLLTTTADQINSIFNEGGEGTFENLLVNNTLTLLNHDGLTMGLKLGSTLVTATGLELNYVDTTPGVAEPSKALVFDEFVNITNINSLTANALTGTIQTAAQPLITSVTTLDITAHDGETQGLKLGGVLLTATATQINSIFGEGGEGTFNNLRVNDTLTLANHDGATMGLVLGQTLLTASGIELNYLDGSVPGTASAGNALVLDALSSIAGINSLSATSLTGTLQTAAQPNITSVGELTSLAVAGDVTIGTTTLSENEVAVLDAVVPGTVAALKAVVVDINKDISEFRNLTALNLIATDVSGTLQTAAQPNITSVGELTSLVVAGDVNVGGSLNVGGTFISENEIQALDAAEPGTATANKAMVTDEFNSIGSINVLTATSLAGTLLTTAQPNITSVGDLVSLNVIGDVTVGNNLNVGGTFISEAEIQALDAAEPGTATANKAMVTDSENSIGGVNVFEATTLIGTLGTASQPNITSVSELDITSHDGALVGLKLGGILVTSTASELNYVDTTVGQAQASKALVLDESKDIAGINTVSMVSLVSETGSITSVADSTSPITGALTIAGGVGIAQSLNIGGAVSAQSTISVSGVLSALNDTQSTSASTGSIVTAGGIGIGKSLFVAGNSTVVGNVSVTGTSTHAGVVSITNATESTTDTNGALIVNGGVGVAKSINVGLDASVGGNFDVNGTSQLTGDLTLLSTTATTSASTGSLVTAGGVGIAKGLTVGGSVQIVGGLSVTGATTQSGLVSITNVTDSTSVLTGSFVTAGGAGIARNLFVGGLARLTDITESTSATTGSLVVAGGVGFGQDVNVAGSVSVGGDLSMSGSMVINGGIESASLTLTHSPETTSNFEIKALSEYMLSESGTGYQWNSGSTETDSGIQLMQLNSSELTINTVGSITSVVDSVSTTTGALKVAGGVGIVKNLNVGVDAAIGGTLSVVGASTLGGVVDVTNVLDSTSTTSGAIVTAGGVGIAKSLNVGVNATVGGNVEVAGTSLLTGAVSVASVDESSSSSTGSLTTAGGVGIAKSLFVGVNASVEGTLSVTGASTLVGDVAVSSVSESTSVETGSIVTAGGVGIAKSLHVGVNASVAGDLSVVGAAAHSGLVSVLNTTESIDLVSGSIVTAGGVGIAKNLNVGGISTISNATPSTSATTGALVVSGGVGVLSDINVGGDIGIAGDMNLSGDFNLSGRFTTTNVSLIPDASSPFSTIPLTNITNTDSLLALNKDVGIGYVESSASIVAIPALITTSSVVYYASNSTSDWSTLGLRDAALAEYNASYSGHAIRVNQLYVNSFSGKIWLGGAFFTQTSSVAIVLSGDIDNGINTLYVVGSPSSTEGTIECTRIAVGTDDNHLVVIRTDGVAPELYRMDIATDPTFSLVIAGSFVSVAWLNGLGKFVATRSDVSSIYTSTDGSGSSWVDATTPTAVAPNTVFYNTTINLAVAIGPDFLWYSTNGLTWVDGSYAALASGDVFNAVVNSPVSGLIAVYSNINNSVAQLYYSLDAINWIVVELTGPTFGHSVPLTSTVAFNSSNFAFALGDNGGVDTIQRIGPITSTSMIYGVKATAGYLTSESAIGYEWYSDSTATSVGTEIMELSKDGLVIKPVVDIENTTNSNSPSSGSLVTTGGVGIAKNLNVGANLTVGGLVTLEGSLDQTGRTRVFDNTDSVSPSTGAITTAGGVGMSKALSVGTSATIGTSLSVGGASSLTGSVSIISTTESSSELTGSLITAGGVGIAKSLTVGLNAQIVGDMTVNGMTSQIGVLNVLNSTSSSSSSTGSIVTAGGVGIAQELFVGTNANVGGMLSVSGASTLQGVLTVSNITDAESVSTGALRVAGGVGIAKSLHVGLGASVFGALSVGGASTLSGDVVIGSTTESASVLTGSIVTAGGVGIAKKLYVGSDASIGGGLVVAGLSSVTDVSDSLSVTTGSFTTAGGVGIAKSLHVGTGIHGTIETAAQPNISSVTVLNITGANALDAGLSLAGQLITATATEINYLDGSMPGTATAGNAIVLDSIKNIVGINELTAEELTGTIQTAAQPLITSVTTLDITGHDGVEAGLKLGGVLLQVTSNELNSLFNGTSDLTVVNATVTQNLTLSGADGSTTGLILGTTLVTATGDELNYVDTTQGVAQPSKALVLNADSDISGINSITANAFTGLLQTAYQPNLTSVFTLDIVGHNASTTGLSLNGVLITSTAEELNYVDTTPGTAEASKALVLDVDKNITGINSLSAISLTGTLLTAAQPNITSVGTLTSLAVAGDITIGSTILSEIDLAKIDGITDGTAFANKALVLNADKNISGINALQTTTLSIGTPVGSDLPLEVGTTPYLFTGSYAYSNDQNAHGYVEAGMGTTADYSARFSGRVIVTGEVQVTSDRRLKTNVSDISLDMAKRFVMESQPIRFNWKNGDKIPELGWLAQSVYKLGGGLEELVTITPEVGLQEEIDEDGFVNPADAKFTLATGKVIPLLTMTAKDLYKQNQEKDAKIADLEARLARLEEMFMKMN